MHRCENAVHTYLFTCRFITKTVTTKTAIISSLCYSLINVDISFWETHSDRTLWEEQSVKRIN